MGHSLSCRLAHLLKTRGEFLFFIQALPNTLCSKTFQCFSDRWHWALLDAAKLLEVALNLQLLLFLWWQLFLWQTTPKKNMLNYFTFVNFQMHVAFDTYLYFELLAKLNTLCKSDCTLTIYEKLLQNKKTKIRQVWTTVQLIEWLIIKCKVVNNAPKAMDLIGLLYNQSVRIICQ